MNVIKSNVRIKMSLNDLIAQDLERHEAFKTKVYFDTEGVATFGIGFTYITIDEARWILRRRVSECRTELGKVLPNFESYPSGAKRALVNMRFNLGLEGLLNFKKMLVSIQEGNYIEAAKNGLQSKWATQVKGRAVEVTNWIKSA